VDAHDHDMTRGRGVTGDQFVDWRGIASRRVASTHATIAGQTAFVNPVGLAHPDSAADPRLRDATRSPWPVTRQ
jgi:hypothetical protein